MITRAITIPVNELPKLLGILDIEIESVELEISGGSDSIHRADNNPINFYFKIVEKEQPAVGWKQFQKDGLEIEAETARMIAEEGYSQKAYGISKPVRMKKMADNEGKRDSK